MTRRNEAALRKLWRFLFSRKTIVVGPEDVMVRNPQDQTPVPRQPQHPIGEANELARRELSDILQGGRHNRGAIRRALDHWRDKWHTELDTEAIKVQTERIRAAKENIQAQNELTRAANEAVQMPQTLQRESAAAKEARELAEREHDVRMQELQRKQDLDPKLRELDQAKIDAEIKSLRAQEPPRGGSDDVNMRAMQALDAYRAMRNRLLKLGLRNDAVTERVEAELALDKEFFTKLGVDPEVVRYLEEKTRRMLENLEEEQ